MKTHASPSIEILENRIAPAGGVVGVTYDPATGVLTLMGDTGDNDVNVFQTAPGQHRIEAINGTTLTGGATSMDIGKLTSLTIDAREGADDFELTNLLTLAKLSFDGGSGADTFHSTNLNVKGPVDVFTGIRGDDVFFDGGATLIGGDLHLNDAADGQLAFLFAGKTVIGGRLLVDGGTGTNEVFGARPPAADPIDASILIAKGILFNAGAGGGVLSFDNQGGTTIGKLPTGESVLFNGGNGADTLEFKSVGVTLAGGIKMTGGAAADTLSFFEPQSITKIGKLPTGQSILFDAGTGNATLRFTATKLTAAGGIEFIGGDGTNDMIFGVSTISGISGGTATIGKLPTGESIKFSGAGNADSLTADLARLTLAGGIDFNVGAGTNKLSLFSPNGTVKLGKLATGESLHYNGGNDADTFTTDATLFTAAGGLTFEGRGGTNKLAFTNFVQTVTIGKLATGPSIDYTGESGDDSISFNPGIATLAGGIDFNAGKGMNSLSLSGDGIVKVGTIPTGQSIRLLGGGKAAVLKSSVEMLGGSSFLTVDGSAVTIGRSALGDSVLLGGAQAVLEMSAGAITFLGNVTVNGSSGSDALVTSHTLNRLTAKGDVSFDGSGGDDTFFLDAFALTIGGKLTFTGGTGTDNATVAAEGSIGGDVLLDLGAATAADQTATLKSRQGLRSGLRLNGTLTVNSAVAAGDTDSLTITNVAVAKAINITLGAGNGFVSIDNLVAGDVLNIFNGEGNNSVFIERGDFAGNSVIAKLASIQFGNGTDTLLIARATPLPNGGAADSTRVRFLGGLFADGGGGTDTRNVDLLTENDFPPGVLQQLDSF